MDRGKIGKIKKYLKDNLEDMESVLGVSMTIGNGRFNYSSVTLKIEFSEVSEERNNTNSIYNVA